MSEGRGGADLIFTAAFDDQTKKFFDQFNANIERMNAKASTGLAKTQGGAKRSEAAMGALAGAVAGVTMQLAQMAIQAAKALPRLIADSTRLAAQAEVTETALFKVAEINGVLASAVEETRDQMVDMTFAQGSANEALLRMIGSNLDLADATDLANAALDISTILGRSEEETLRRLIHAITTENTLILRDLQLNDAMANARRAMTQAAKEQGVSVDQLNRKQFVLNAVLQESQRFQGAYASASAMAGTEASELGEKITNLKTEFGKTFLPAYLVFLQNLSSAVQNATQWFEDNEETVAAVGDALAVVAAVIVDLIKVAGTLAKTLIAPLGILKGIVQSATGMKDLGTTAKQAFTLIAAGAAMVVTFLNEIVDGAVLAGRALGALFRGDFQEVGQIGADMMLNFLDATAKAEQAGKDTFLRYSELFGLVEADAPESANAMKKIAEETDKLGVSLEEAGKKLAELNRKFTEEAAKVALQRMRQDIDNAIQEARQREDIERGHMDRLAGIREDAGKAQANLDATQAGERLALEERFAEQRIGIERDYRRTLEDIQRNFQYSAQELARKNDAVGLLQLQRQTKKQMGDAKISRDRRNSDAKEAQNRERQALQASQAQQRTDLAADLAERLRMAEEQRQADIANLERSLARQQEDQERHRRWEDIDRINAFNKELAETGAHFATMQGLTTNHLQGLVSTNASAVANLDAMWGAYYARQSARTGGIVGAPGGVTPGRIGGERQFQRGGAMIARRPTQVMIGEGGAEAFAAMPLGQTVNHRLSGSASINVGGVSPQMEADLKPQLYSALVDIIQSARA